MNSLGLKQKIKSLVARDFISLKPVGDVKGKVLISYVLEPFIFKNISNSHTNKWECKEIAKIFLDLGYQVDIINWDNSKFIPKKKYSYFIDIHSNLERISPYLNKDCTKILHITGAHWLFQNRAEYGRLLALQQRRGITLRPRRLAQPSLGIETSDYATMLGNQFTFETFSYAKKPIHRIPISTQVLYDWPEDKDYEACKNHFIWFGGSGMVHKGLDLVLEAFAKMPEYHLTVCGPVKNEKDFEIAFFKELYQTPNINTIGWIDISSSKFVEITKSCIGLIYPSCSEGQAGSVITCLHAGLIPILSYESGVDIHDFGTLLKNCSTDEIENSIKELSESSINNLILRSRKAWEFAREYHTKEKFSESYADFVINVLKA